MKYSSTSVLGQADGLEDLRHRVRADGADAHLAHDLEDALAERLDHVAHGLRGLDAGQRAVADEVLDRLERQVRVDRGGAVAEQQRDVVHLAAVAGLDDEADLHAGLLAHQVVVHGGGHQQRRDRRALLVAVAVGQHDDPGAGRDRLGRPWSAAARSPRRSAAPPPLTSKWPVIRTAAKPGRSPSSSMCRILASSSLSMTGNGRTTCRQDAGVACSRFCSGPKVRPEAGDQLLADGVQRRVGHLGEQLAEVVVEQPRPVRQRRDRGVGAHRADRLGAGGGHRRRPGRAAPPRCSRRASAGGRRTRGWAATRRALGQLRAGAPGRRAASRRTGARRPARP